MDGTSDLKMRNERLRAVEPVGMFMWPLRARGGWDLELVIPQLWTLQSWSRCDLFEVGSPGRLKEKAHCSQASEFWLWTGQVEMRT